MIEKKKMSFLRMAFWYFVEFPTMDHFGARFKYIWTLYKKSAHKIITANLS